VKREGQGKGTQRREEATFDGSGSSLVGAIYVVESETHKEKREGAVVKKGGGNPGGITYARLKGSSASPNSKITVG